MPGIKLLHIKLCVSFLFFPKTRICMQLSREEEAALRKFYFKHLFPALPCIYLKGEQRGKSGMFCTLLLQFFLPSRASPHVTTQLKLALNILSCRGDFYDAPSHSLIPRLLCLGSFWGSELQPRAHVLDGHGACTLMDWEFLRSSTRPIPG